MSSAGVWIYLMKAEGEKSGVGVRTCCLVQWSDAFTLCLALIFDCPLFVGNWGVDSWHVLLVPSFIAVCLK